MVLDGNGVGVYVSVCVLHRREPHGVLAPFTHHMHDHSRQLESVVGEGETGDMDVTPS